jgi:hypothetical protein
MTPTPGMTEKERGALDAAFRTIAETLDAISYKRTIWRVELPNGRVFKFKADSYAKARSQAAREDEAQTAAARAEFAEDA